jgi:hypothetical protein
MLGILSCLALKISECIKVLLVRVVGEWQNNSYFSYRQFKDYLFSDIGITVFIK